MVKKGEVTAFSKASIKIKGEVLKVWI